VTVNSPTEVHYTLKPSVGENGIADQSTIQDSSSDSRSDLSPPDVSRSTENDLPVSETRGFRDPQPKAEAQIASNVRLPANVWFALVAVASKKRVFIQQQTGQMALEAIDAPMSEDWIRIDPLAGEDHCIIARAFSDHIPLAHRSRIHSQIGSSAIWWKDHFSAVEQLGLASAYKRFHSTQALQLIDRKIRDQVGRGITDLRLPGGRLVSEYISPPHTRTVGQAKPVAVRFSSIPEKEDLLRSLAARVVQNMSRAELRRIKVSLGDVVDLL